MESFFMFLFVTVVAVVLFAYGIKEGMTSQQKIDQKIAVQKGCAEYDSITAKFQWRK